MSPRLFFASEFTIAEMATQVMKQQIKRADPQEVAELAKKLNELSDEEVKALLAKKSSSLKRNARSECRSIPSFGLSR